MYIALTTIAQVTKETGNIFKENEKKLQKYKMIVAPLTRDAMIFRYRLFYCW